MLQEFREYGHPFFFDVVIIAGKFPNRLVFVILGLELVTFIRQGLADVFPFHQVLVIEKYFKSGTCLAGTGYFLDLGDFDGAFGELVEVIKHLRVS